MTNFGARTAVKHGDFGIFEGDAVVAGSLAFQGSRAAEGPLQEGDTVMLLIQAEVRSIAFSRNADGDLVRRHTMRVVEATEPPAEINAQVVDAIRAATDEREGREPLPFDGEDGEGNADDAEVES